MGNGGTIAGLGGARAGARRGSLGSFRGVGGPVGGCAEPRVVTISENLGNMTDFLGYRGTISLLVPVF